MTSLHQTIIDTVEERLPMNKVKDDTQEFEEKKKERIKGYAQKTSLLKTGEDFLQESLKHDYSYNFHWLGLPIIQYPQDIVAMQEIIFKTKPDLIIETGVARGGSVLLYASLLEMMQSNGIVIGVDIDIRPHNRKRIISNPLSHRIRLIESSSIAPETTEMVKELAEGKQRIMVVLDSNHTHQHVLEELNLYSSFVSDGCYMVVFDTVVEGMPAGSFPGRPWDKGNNPQTAVKEFLTLNSMFEIDTMLEQKLIITAAPSGYLRKIKTTRL